MSFQEEFDNINNNIERYSEYAKSECYAIDVLNKVVFMKLRFNCSEKTQVLIVPLLF